MKYLILIISIAISHSGFSQNLLTNKKLIDEKRYKEIKGSPYYYDDHQQAQLTIQGDPKPFDVLMNINLYENVIEVFQGKYYADVDYAAISEIKLADSTSIVYTVKQLTILPYLGEKYKLSCNPTVKIETKTLRPPGQIIEQQKFVKRESYTLIIDDSAHDIDLNKKSIQKALGKSAISVAKDNKIKLKSAQDLAALLAILDQG